MSLYNINSIHVNIWEKHFEVYLTHLVAFLDVLVSNINIWQVLNIT
jgi:hypothetical protein